MEGSWYHGAPRLASAGTQTSLPPDCELQQQLCIRVCIHKMRPAVRLALRQFRHASQQQRCCLASAQLASIEANRSFHCSPVRSTDGVFKELTAMRVKTPWIEALRSQQAEGEEAAGSSGKGQVPKDRDLTPKHMSDSYHSLVLPLAQDPWLLDTASLPCVLSA